MSSWRSWWVGRFWMLTGTWLLVAGIWTGLLAIGRLVTELKGETSPGSSSMVEGLCALLFTAVGIGSMWAGRQRFMRVADQPDAIEHAVARLRRPSVLKWMLAVLGSSSLLLILVWPWVISRDDADFVKRNGITGFEYIHEIRSGDAGWTAVLSGRLDPERVEWFIARNALLPVPKESGLPFLIGVPVHEWEKIWPLDPLWYARRTPRPRDICRGGCSIVCLVDRRSGRVWIAVQEPDFAGD